MPIIERHIRIEAPIERVWDVLVDIPGQPRWMKDLKSVRIEGDAPVGVGTLAIGEVRMFGLSQPDPIVITAYDRPTRYGIAHVGAFTGTGEFRLRPVDGGTATVVEWREDLEPTAQAIPLIGTLARVPIVGRPVRPIARVLARIVSPLLWPLFAWVFRDDLRRLRRLVEAEPS